jgi:hypothetical protein
VNASQVPLMAETSIFPLLINASISEELPIVPAMMTPPFVPGPVVLNVVKPVMLKIIEALFGLPLKYEPALKAGTPEVSDAFERMTDPLEPVTLPKSCDKSLAAFSTAGQSLVSAIIWTEEPPEANSCEPAEALKAMVAFWPIARAVLARDSNDSNGRSGIMVTRSLNKDTRVINLAAMWSPPNYLYWQHSLQTPHDSIQAVPYSRIDGIDRRWMYRVFWLKETSL